LKIYLFQELEKGFDHWKKIFDSLEDRREKVGIKTIVAACEAENFNKMHCILEIPSMDAIKEYMMNQENQDAMKNAGVIQEGRIMIPLKD
tara:strand:- start:2342 stop:2611 length:270 start_codon:yes stop_codon:yes gene_type:complete